MYILAKKIDQSIIEILGPLTYEPADSEILSMAVAKYGSAIDDYTVFRINDGCINQKRISAGEKFNLVWSDGNIVNIDFAIEDSSFIMRFYPTNPMGVITDTIIADDIDYVDINMSIWFSDLSGIDTSFNENLLVPVYNPLKKLTFVKVTFVNGVSQKRFSTTEYGIWTIPLGYKFQEANVKISYEQILDINVLMFI
jgi:hypothetical protein